MEKLFLEQLIKLSNQMVEMKTELKADIKELSRKIEEKPNIQQEKLLNNIEEKFKEQEEKLLGHIDEI